MNCDTCIYLGSQTVGGIPSLQGTALPEHAVCRRNAPGAKGWPIIPFPDTDWCGQHKAKTPPERGGCAECRHMRRGEKRNECHEQPRPVWNGDQLVTFPTVYDWESCGRWEAKP